MFKITSGKSPDLDWQDTVTTWGIVHVPADEYICLEFGNYYLKFEWGFTDV